MSENEPCNCADSSECCDKLSEVRVALRQIANTDGFPSDEAHQDCVDIAKELLASDWDCQNRDELEAISAVEKDSPAALESVLLIANEALAAVKKEQ